jgi:hypothetical protein
MSTLSRIINFITCGTYCKNKDSCGEVPCKDEFTFTKVNLEDEKPRPTELEWSGRSVTPDSNKYPLEDLKLPDEEAGAPTE